METPRAWCSIAPSADRLGVPARILLVDDEETVLFALADYFRERGYRVDCARELEEAQALLTHVAYACMITDMRLSKGHGAEGIELASFVRRSCSRTRVLMLSAYASSDVATLATSRGVDAILRKPIALELLADHVLRLVTSS